MKFAEQFTRLHPLILILFVFVPSCLSAQPSGEYVSEPVIVITPEGRVLVSIASREPFRAGEASLGIIPEMAPLKYPQYALNTDLDCSNPFKLHCWFNLKDLEDKEIDVNDLNSDGWGTLALEVRLYSIPPQVLERRFAYRRSAAGQYFRAPALIEGPLVNCVTDTSAVISIGINPMPVFNRPTAEGTGDLKKSSQWKVEIQPLNRLIAGPESSRGTLTITGLHPDNEYAYRVIWRDSCREYSSPTYSFRTAPASGSDQPFRFAVLCDSRAGVKDNMEGVSQGILRALMNQAFVQGVSFILFPGDLVYGPHTDAMVLQRQFDSWKRLVQPVGAQIPVYTGLGNHDQMRRWIPGGSKQDYAPLRGHNSGEEIFAHNFSNPLNGPDSVGADMPTYRENVYSFDWGPAHFVMLNTNYFQKGRGKLAADQPGDVQGTLRQEQLDWLDRDLEKARSRGQEHLFVSAHEPAFPNGGHIKDAMWWEGKRPEMIRQRNLFWKILCHHKVIAAFFGHEHNYSRMLVDNSVNSEYDYPIWQIITGGAGAPFYDRDLSVPWAGAVKAFYPLPHLCLVEIEGENTWLNVLTPEGALVERVNLNER